jgi:hypothetical protein
VDRLEIEPLRIRADRKFTVSCLEDSHRLCGSRTDSTR